MEKRRTSLFYRILSAFIAFTFSFTSVIPPSYAQTIGALNLPVPGTMVPLSPAFVPILLKGMTIHPDNPLQFDFIIDSGNTGLDIGTGLDLSLQKESERLVKYFLASMTIPKDDLWVNLSPYENDRIIPDELGKTDLGRDMLAQDYILKQLTASLMYPEKELGKEFWDKVYQKAKEKFGTTEIPVNTFNKVWILPDTATVYEHGQTVYIVEARLRVMLDSDYEAQQSHQVTKSQGHQKAVTGDVVTGDPVTTQIVREVILPAIEKEVNEGQNFAPLRQIYHSLILAKWYKETIKESLLSKVYVDQKKIAGVNTDDPTLKDQIYAQYMEAYKKGVFNYIKEDYDRLSNETIPRKYFSGGEQFTNFEVIKLEKTNNPARVASAKVGKHFELKTRANPQKQDDQSSSPLSRAEAQALIEERLETQYPGHSEYKELITDEAIDSVVRSMDRRGHIDITYYEYMYATEGYEHEKIPTNAPDMYGAGYFVWREPSISITSRDRRDGESSSPITSQVAEAMIKGKLAPEYHHLINDTHVQLAMAYEGNFNVVYHAGAPERIEIIRGSLPIFAIPNSVAEEMRNDWEHFYSTTSAQGAAKIDTPTFDDFFQGPGTKKFERRRLGDFAIQYNPRRATRRPPAELTNSSVNQGFDPEAFNFTKADGERRQNSRFRAQNINSVDVEINPQPKPFSRMGHILVLPRRDSRLKQFLVPDGIRVALGMVQDSPKDAHLKVAFNSMNAFGTVNHLHLQTLYYESLDIPDQAGPMPIENFSLSAIASIVENDQTVTLNVLEDYPAKVFVVEGKDIQALEKTIGSVVAVLQKDNKPHNVVFTKNKDNGNLIRAYIFPRKTQEMSPFGIGTGIAFFELCGELIVTIKNDSDKLEHITAVKEKITEIQSKLKSLTVQKEIVKVKKQIKDLRKVLGLLPIARGYDQITDPEEFKKALRNTSIDDQTFEALRNKALPGFEWVN